MKIGGRLGRFIAYQFAGALLVVLLCTLVSCAVTWRGMRRQISDWTLENNSRLLDQYARYVGASLATSADEIYMQLLNEVSSNKAFGFFQNTLGSGNLLDTLEVQNTLVSIQNANVMLSSVGIYYPRNDLLIESGRIRYTLFYEDNRAELERYAERMRSAQEKGGADYAIEATPSSIYFIRTIQRGAQAQAAVFTCFSSARLRENIAATIPFEGGNLLVADAQGQVLFDLHGNLAGRPLSDTPDFAALSNASGSFSRKTDGGEEMVSYITDGTNGWRYIVSVPLDLFDDPREYFLQSLFFSALLTLALGALLAVAYSLWQSRPLRPIVRILDETGLSEQRDPYGAIQGTLTRLRALADDQGTALARLMPTLRSDFMFWLLTELPRDPGEIEDRMLLSRVSFPHPRFSVVAAYAVADDSQLPVAQAGVRFALEQALGTPDTLCGLCRRDELILALVNHDLDDEALVGAVHKALGTPPDGALRCHYTVVGLTDGLPSLENAVMAARTAVRRSYLYPETAYFPADGPCDAADAQFPMRRLLSAFSAALRAGNEAAALDAVNGAVREARSAGISAQHARRLALELTAELESACGDRPELSRSLMRLLAESPDILSFAADLAEFVRSALGLLEPRPCRSSVELADSAAAMVDDGILDSQLSLTGVAAALGVSPNYLSRVFHEVRGTTFVEYAAGAKLAHARRLLEETDRTLRDISEEIHYASPQYFISRFKKQYGVTPSVWREQRRAARPAAK